MPLASSYQQHIIHHFEPEEWTLPPLLSEYLRNARFDAVRPYVRGSVLDLGCGPVNIRQLVKSDQIYLGVERDPATLDWLKERFPEHIFIARNLETQQLDLGRRFDTILMLAILEHLADPGFLLSQLSDHLEAAGQVVVTTPTPFGGLIHSLGARFGIFYREALDEHKAFFGRRELEGLILANGMRMTAYQTFLFRGNQLAVARHRK